MLPAVLRIRKYMWLKFYVYFLKIFIPCIFWIFIKTAFPGNNVWLTISGTCTTVWETV